ncbi:MAG: acyloxyacyl hydrolase [Bacteroidota bacterium]
MNIKRISAGLNSITFLLQCFFVSAQDKRTQYPPGLNNAYFGVNIGYINYPFSMLQLEPGYSADAVAVPHTAVRIVLYGCPINKYLSARITYMRPVNWVQYKNVNGDRQNHSVWMNIAGLTLQGQLPLGEKISIAAEAGLSVITRNGFEINNIPVVKNANYGTGLFGGAIQYHLSKKWDLQMSAAWSPENKKVKQPHTLFVAAGFNYNLRPLSKEKEERNARNGYNFPREFILAGYTTNAAGYGVNDFASKGAVPFFWGGDAHVKQGFTLSYQRNIFHARKVFAMDWAAHIGFWKSKGLKENFFTASLNPVFRFTAIRSKPADIFFEYSVAGPTFISKTNVDNVPLGRRFTFHDFMGMGVFAGTKRKLHAGIRIAHYSNGNIFPQNDGVKVPLTFNLGYVLK